jgi:D-serine dehydratase
MKDAIEVHYAMRKAAWQPTNDKVTSMLTASSLPRGGLTLASLDEQILQPGTKGLPITEPLRQGAIAVQGWNVLRGDTSFPVAVLKSSALQHNLDWMRKFCAQYGATLAPHGKTTMSPQLFGAQIANGAWGLTLATATQVQVAHRFGVRRVLLANQLVGKADINGMLQLLHDDPDFELYALVDSEQGVARLADAVAAHPLARPLPLLVELGIAGKRAGCRSDDEAMAVARAVARSPGLQLAGIEGYEGLLVSDDRAADVKAVEAFVSRIVAFARQADEERLFAGEQILLSAGGSAYFDLVARGFKGVRGLSLPVHAVLRSGCYLTSDHGSYLRLIGQLNEREAQPPADGLRPALEVWSVVQSRPEPGLAILTMGKRDASYDIDLPIPLYAHRPGPGMPGALPAGCSIVKMNDQHAYLQLPADDPIRDTLAVGDLVGCGISHPCTTFDKWPLLLAVDDEYGVRFALNTFF